MKRLQKIAAAVLALTLVLTSLTACSDQAPKPRSAGEVGKDAVSMVETSLSEEEMRAAIDGYADALTEALAGGGAVAKFVDNKDGSVALVVMPDGTDTTQELMKFGSVKEAFSYFVYTGQMDADGKIVTPPVVQTAPGQDTETSTPDAAATSEAAPSDATSEPASTATSEVTSDVTADTGAETPVPAPDMPAPESVPALAPDAAASAVA